MSADLTKTLEAAGLAEKEAKVYVALLELELAPVFEIAKQSGLNRSTVYVVLESLKKKGLAGTSPDNPKVVQYFASSPDSLLHIVSSRAKHEQEIKENLEQIIPELKALHKDTRHRPKVKVYEGKEGMKEAIFTLFEKPVKELKAAADASKMYKFIPNFHEHNLERGKRGVRMLAINPATKEMLEYEKKKPYLLPSGDQTVMVPENKFKFPVNIGIYGDSMGFLSFEGKYAILIQNKELAESIENLFDLAWEEAKRLDKKIKKKLKVSGRNAKRAHKHKKQR